MEFRVGKFAWIALAGTVIAVAGAGAASAVNGESAAKRYTGCLKTDGTIAQMKAGDSPKAACSGTQSQITISNGDITGIVAGTGLSGGADQGTATVGLQSEYALPQGCAVGRPAKKAASGWFCGTDNGTFSKTVGPLTADVQTGTAQGKCVGDYGYLDYAQPSTGDSGVTSAAFTLPSGTYLPTMAATTRWFVNRTYDMYDGEQFSSGYVRVRLVRTRSGATTTVGTWARASSENSDGAGLPYNQDPGVFVALSSDSYKLVAEAEAALCTRARVLDAGMDFTRIG